MKKENIVDLLTYQHQQHKDDHSPISKELEDAIESLIIQLRDLGPLKENAK